MNLYLNRMWDSLYGPRRPLWLALAVALVYLPFLNSPFFFDDIHFFNRAVQYYAAAGFHLDLRWFPYASLGWTATVFSDVVPIFFHVGNALIHFGSVLLLYLLLRDIAMAVLPDAAVLPIQRGAVLAALLFAVHPVAVYAVGYVVQRSILMATFFGLLMCWAHLRGIVSGRRRWLLVAVAAYFLACFSKEHSVLLPLVLAAQAILLRGQNRLPGLASFAAAVGCLGIFLLVVLRARGVFGSPYEAMASTLFEQQGIVAATPALHLLSVLTQAGLFFKYLFLWAFPNPAWMSVDMREQFISDWSAWRGWLGALAYLAYGLLAFRWLWRGGERGLVGFALLYPWLLFPIEFSSIRVQEPFVLYRSYLWAPGLFLLILLLSHRFPSRRTGVALMMAILLLVPLAWNRLWVMADKFRMWDDAASLLQDERVPGADRIFFNRGQAEAAAQQWDNAALDFERAVALSPQFAPIHIQLGQAYARLGRHEAALREFDQALELDPKEDRVYYLKAVELQHLGRKAESVIWMKKSCETGNLAACLMLIK